MACLGSPTRKSAPLRIWNSVQWACGLVGGGFAAKTPEDFCLERIGVLKLVDKHVQEALAERAPHVFMVAQKIPRRENQIVEIK